MTRWCTKHDFIISSRWCLFPGCAKVLENANGCGPSASKLTIFALHKDTLKCACDRHDICYACVSMRWNSGHWIYHQEFTMQYYFLYALYFIYKIVATNFCKQQKNINHSFEYKQKWDLSMTYIPQSIHSL